MTLNNIRSWLAKLNRPRKEPGSTIKKSLPPNERLRLLERARHCVQQQDYNGANVVVRTLLLSNPSDGDALAIEGLQQYTRRNFQSAISALQLALRNGTTDHKAKEYLIASLLSIGDDDTALTISKAYFSETKTPSISNLLGVLHMRKENFLDAASHLNDAVATSPKNYIAIANLQALYDRCGSFLGHQVISDKSKRVFKTTLQHLIKERRTRDLSDDESLGLLALASNSEKTFVVALNEAERVYSKPVVSDALSEYAGVIFSRIGDTERAIEMHEQGKSSVRGSCIALGHALIAQGGERWFEGWLLLDEGFHRLYRSSSEHRVPDWSGGKVKGGKLFVYQDQGFGDVLLGLRLLAHLTANGIKPILWVRKEIAELLRIAEGAATIISPEEKPNPTDFGCLAAAPLLGLVKRMRLRPSDLKPHATIKIPEERVGVWREKILKHSPKGALVGLAAFGNPTRQDDWYRSVDVDEVTSFNVIPNITWVNLSVDERPERSKISESLSMVDLTSEIESYLDTACLIANLDIVVAIDCSVAHLAAAMGKKLIVLLSPALEWRWKIGADASPWWPDAEVIRCKTPGDWTEAMQQARTRIRELIDQR